MKNFPKLNARYRLITASNEINQVQNLEKNLYVPFEYERDFLEFPFQEHFDAYSFLESHDFFRKEERYNMLIAFLKSINSSSFFVSAPPYCGLYPLQVSVDCPFEVYKNAISYVLEETVINSQNQEVNQPLGHPMRGAGFVIMPHVFIYDETTQWAMLLDDNVTAIAVIGLKQSVREHFKGSLGKVEFTSTLELMRKPNLKIYNLDFEKKLLDTFGNVIP